MPITHRQDMLNRIHETHQGSVKSKQRTRGLRYWPCMNSQIEDMILRCAACQEMRKIPAAEPLIPHDHGPKSQLTCYITRKRLSVMHRLLLDIPRNKSAFKHN